MEALCDICMTASGANPMLRRKNGRDVVSGSIVCPHMTMND